MPLCAAVVRSDEGGKNQVHCIAVAIDGDQYCPVHRRMAQLAVAANLARTAKEQGRDQARIRADVAGVAWDALVADWTWLADNAREASDRNACNAALKVIAPAVVAPVVVAKAEASA